MHKGKRKVSCSSDSLISSILLLDRKTLKNYIDEKFESSSDNRMLMSNDFHRMNVQLLDNCEKCLKEMQEK